MQKKYLLPPLSTESIITNADCWEEKEIGFEATINRVENGIAYATVTEDDAGFGAKKLPESIMFETVDLDTELQAGDKISGCYLRSTIDGQTARVVSVVVITD